MNPALLKTEDVKSPSALVNYAARKAKAYDDNKGHPPTMPGAQPRLHSFSPRRNLNQLVKVTVKSIADEPMKDGNFDIDTHGKTSPDRLGRSLGARNFDNDDGNEGSIKFRVRRGSLGTMSQFQSNGNSGFGLNTASYHQLQLETRSRHKQIPSKTDSARGRSPQQRAPRRKSAAGSLVLPPKYWAESSPTRAQGPMPPKSNHRMKLQKSNSFAGLLLVEEEDFIPCRHRRSSLGASCTRLDMSDHEQTTAKTNRRKERRQQRRRSRQKQRQSPDASPNNSRGPSPVQKTGSCPNLMDSDAGGPDLHTSTNNGNLLSSASAHYPRTPPKRQEPHRHSLRHKSPSPNCSNPQDDIMKQLDASTHFLTKTRIRRLSISPIHSPPRGLSPSTTCKDASARRRNVPKFILQKSGSCPRLMIDLVDRDNYPPNGLPLSSASAHPPTTARRQQRRHSLKHNQLSSSAAPQEDTLNHTMDASLFLPKTRIRRHSISPVHAPIRQLSPSPTRKAVSISINKTRLAKEQTVASS